MIESLRNFKIVGLFAAATVAMCSASVSPGQEVVVAGGVEEVRELLDDEDWWGSLPEKRPLSVPKLLVTGINPNWRTTAQKLTVPDKKQVFYRLMLPLIVHANDMVRMRRAQLDSIRSRLASGEAVAAEDTLFLQTLAPLLRIQSAEAVEQMAPDDHELLTIVDEALYRLDVIPAGLVLGQAAYESGYGTSRFAVDGNALFGQWTYGGKGMVPEQQRKDLGDHRIAAYDWPFDSVRGYYINLSSHPAYEDFRRLRAQLKAENKPVTSLALADGLTGYSERGQEYVDTLKSIIRVNNLDAADGAEFRDEAMRFFVGAENPEAADALRAGIRQMRETGELEKIADRMRLE